MCWSPCNSEIRWCVLLSELFVTDGVFCFLDDAEELNETLKDWNCAAETELTSDMTLHWSEEDEDVTVKIIIILFVSHTFQATSTNFRSVQRDDDGRKKKQNTVTQIRNNNMTFTNKIIQKVKMYYVNN